MVYFFEQTERFPPKTVTLVREYEEWIVGQGMQSGQTLEPRYPIRRWNLNEPPFFNFEIEE